MFTIDWKLRSIGPPFSAQPMFFFDVYDRSKLAKATAKKQKKAPESQKSKPHQNANST
jgi:hypothetical protein